jgi:RecB family endonuclease NucS
LIEVKSRAELDHVEALLIKAEAVEKFLKRKVDKIILVAVNVDREAYNRAIDLGIDVIKMDVQKTQSFSSGMNGKV